MNRSDIISDLNRISSKKGFLNVLIRLVAINLNSFVDELATRDNRQILNQNEINYLFGLWLKNRDSDEEELTNIIECANTTHKLMDDLHLTFIKGIDDSSLLPTYEEMFINSASLQETIFYAGTGAYDYQYLDFIKSKYQLDVGWLREKMGVELDDFINFYIYLKAVTNYKLNFKGYAIDSIDVYSLNKKCYIFKKYPNFLKIANLFSLKESDSVNSNFNNVGDFNEFNIKPIIDTGDKFIFPSPYTLAEALYESPFYWMNEDSNYRSKAATNRGICAEHIVRDLLLRIFPLKYVHSNVYVTLNRSTRLTDLDVCLLYNESLIIFQVKSKKLTQLSKNGDLEQIKNDFSKAVEDSFNQVNKIYEPIITNKCKLVDEKGKEVLQTESIRHIYSVCIVLDNYPSLLSHSRIFYHEKIATPIAMTIFDFQVLVEYLKTPSTFLEYIIKRTTFTKTIITDTELSYLKFFLTHKFELPKDSDILMLDSDFGQFFDNHYYMRLVRKYESKFQGLIKSISKNDYCYCGSGKQFKRCCM